MRDRRARFPHSVEVEKGTVFFLEKDMEDIDEEEEYDEEKTLVEVLVEVVEGGRGGVVGSIERTEEGSRPPATINEASPSFFAAAPLPATTVVVAVAPTGSVLEVIRGWEQVVVVVVAGSGVARVEGSPLSLEKNTAGIGASEEAVVVGNDGS